MRIKEAEAETGITAKNIRFYEQEGLLTPAREKMSRYREYAAEDIERLKKIKLMRKLGISLENIKLVLAGIITLRDCMDLRCSEVAEELEHLKNIRAVCGIIANAAPRLELFNAERYMQEIEIREARGERFINILADYITRARNIIPKAAFWFEPQEPILKRENFTDELIRYCREEHLDLNMVHEGMEPVAYIDGVKHLFLLEPPRTLMFRGSPFFMTEKTFGFRFVYAYRYQ